MSKKEELFLHIFEFECQYVDTDRTIRKHKHGYLNQDGIKEFHLGNDSHSRCFSDHTLISIKFIQTTIQVI